MDRDTIAEQLKDIFGKENIEENRTYYMQLCRRKYQKMPEQYEKCREAVAKRFSR